MSTISSTTVTYAKCVCPVCGIHYALDESFSNEKYKVNGSWYCPNGHSLVFTQSKADKLAKELEAKQKQLTSEFENRVYYQNRLLETQKQLDITDRTLKASKTRLKKTKQRVAAGVCPCCNRSFQNLHRHMNGQHPGYAKGEHND
jgi:DNA repair exonuclease SbcCD ATPase subunit